jgi:hypothetical protein
MAACDLREGSATRATTRAPGAGRCAHHSPTIRGGPRVGQGRASRPCSISSCAKTPGDGSLWSLMTSAARHHAAVRVRRPVKPVRRWRWGRGCNGWWSRRGGKSCCAGGSRPARGSRLRSRIVVTFQVFGSDQDEARAGEVHEGMTANTAESHDSSPAPRSHLDRVGTRRDRIANGPYLGGRHEGYERIVVFRDPGVWCDTIAPE